MTLTPNTVSLSSRSFATLGLEKIAYVKTIVENIKPTYAIHASDGTLACCRRGSACRGSHDPPQRPRTREPALSFDGAVTKTISSCARVENPRR